MGSAQPLTMPTVTCPRTMPGQLVDGQPGVGHRVQGGPGEREDGRPHLG